MTLDHGLTDEVRARQRETEADGPVSARPRPPLVSTLGNAAVQRLLRLEHDEEHPTVDTSVEDAIESKRGGGRGLDGDVQERIGGALGADLSDVRVHDDSEADALNHAVSADAFTTGSDVFFRQGKYQPGTTGGDQLLAHELTHVVQQRGAGAESGDMRVSSPQDAAEQEAAAFSTQLSSAPSAAVSPSLARHGAQEDGLQMSPALAREAEPEEEELQMSPSALAREDVPEEEELQMSPSTLAREDVPEEEELQMSPSLERQEMPEEEEEELQASLHRSLHGPSAAAGA